MCGIWGLIQKYKLDSNNNNINNLLKDFWNLKHRGPDNSQLHSFDNSFIGFHRLAIMNNNFTGNQPFIFNELNRTIVFICNGEIYNFNELDIEYDLNINMSDCMSIPKLYIKLGLTKWLELFNNEIKGEFAFMLFEFDNMNHLTQYIVGRDMIGVRPLYTIEQNDIIDVYSSEIKGLQSYNGVVTEFTPGTIKVVKMYSFPILAEGQIVNHTINVINFANIYNIPTTLYKCNILDDIRNSVYNSIKRRLTSERPIAFLLSGGVDSSLVAAISMKILGKPIHTFCCGIKGSTDMKYAKIVAEYIGSIHTEVYFTAEEGLELIDDVIYTTETWDTTTIRASVGQYIVSRYIAQHTDCKVILVGEGPDEVCSSYLFNHYAPSSIALHEAAIEYVKNIHMYDGRRADRCISRWGMECRVAFLDPEFIRSYWSIEPRDRDPKYNNMIEKYMLRKAFDKMNLLPNEVLWRKKEAFSDGISSKEKSWFQMIQEYVTNKINDNRDVFTRFQQELGINLTNEALYYRYLFRKHFGSNRDDIIPNFWQPKWDKDGKVILEYVDPSARVLDIYNSN